MVNSPIAWVNGISFCVDTFIKEWWYNDDDHGLFCVVACGITSYTILYLYPKMVVMGRCRSYNFNFLLQVSSFSLTMGGNGQFQLPQNRQKYQASWNASIEVVHLDVGVGFYIWNIQYNGAPNVYPFVECSTVFVSPSSINPQQTMFKVCSASVFIISSFNR